MMRHTSQSPDYMFTAKQRLSSDEHDSLAKKHWPAIRKLCARYLPDFDISQGFPCDVMFLDVVRGAWLLDQRKDRPSYEEVVSGIGFAFGMVLEKLLKMEWWHIEDNYGEKISMLKLNDCPEAKYKQICISPFNYVAKREDTQNVEVFSDGFREIEEMINDREY